MRERIERYARRLEGLSIQELSESAEKLVGFQRRNEAALIAHLAEISRRQGHLELGYRSLFDYCTRHLGLGKYSVWNRTQVAGVSRRFPRVLEQLAAGKVSLSSLGVLAPHLTDENVDRLLSEAEGKTKDEVKEIIVALDPKPAVEPTIRRQPVRRGEASRQEGSDGGGGDSAPETAPRAETAEPPAFPGSSVGESEPRKPAGSVEPARPEVYNFRFSAGKGLKEKLERLAEVLGIESSTGRMPEIIETALDLALEKKDPKRKLERRRKREAARAGTRPDEAAAGTRPDEVPAARRCGARRFPGAQASRLQLAMARCRRRCSHAASRGSPGARVSRLHLLFSRGARLATGEQDPATSRARGASGLSSRRSIGVSIPGRPAFAARRGWDSRSITSSRTQREAHTGRRTCVFCAGLTTCSRRHGSTGRSS